MLVLYNICDEITWLNVDEWVKRVKEVRSEIPIIIVGNSLVRSSPTTYRKVDQNVASNYAIRNGLLFVEASSGRNTYVMNAFHTLTEKIYKAKDPKKKVKHRVSFR